MADAAAGAASRRRPQAPGQCSAEASSATSRRGRRERPSGRERGCCPRGPAAASQSRGRSRAWRGRRIVPGRICLCSGLAWRPGQLVVGRGGGSVRAQQRTGADRRVCRAGRDWRRGAAARGWGGRREDGPAGRGGRCGRGGWHRGAARRRGGVRGRSDLFRAAPGAASAVRPVRAAGRRAPGRAERRPWLRGGAAAGSAARVHRDPHSATPGGRGQTNAGDRR